MRIPLITKVKVQISYAKHKILAQPQVNYGAQANLKMDSKTLEQVPRLTK